MRQNICIDKDFAGESELENLIEIVNEKCTYDEGYPLVEANALGSSEVGDKIQKILVGQDLQTEMIEVLTNATLHDKTNLLKQIAQQTIEISKLMTKVED